jgi:hypothetical protein
MPVTATLDFASRPNAKFRSQGLLAARPQPEGIGDTYLATDTGQVFTSIDGLNWTLFGGSRVLDDLSDVVAATWTKGALLVGHDAAQWAVWGPGQSGYTPIFDSSQSGGLTAYPFQLRHLLDAESGGPADGEVPTWSTANGQFEWATPGGSGGATFKGARLRRTTGDQSCSSGSVTALQWNTADYDASGLHSTVTHTERITFDADGEIYAIRANVYLTDGGSISANEGAEIQIRHYDASATTTYIVAEQDVDQNITVLSDAGVSLSVDLPVDTGDYIYVTIDNRYDDALNFKADTRSNFSVHRLAV